MVVRYVRRRNDDAGGTGSRNLIERRSAGPGNHQICRNHQFRHVVDVVLQFNLGLFFQIDAGFGNFLRHPFPCALTGGMDMAEGLFLCFQTDEFDHLAVHIPGTETAPGGDDQCFSVITQLFLHGLLVAVDKFRLNGHTNRSNAFLIFVMGPALFESHHDDIHRIRNHLRCQTGNGVGFVNKGRNSQFDALLHRREAGIAAHADNHIGLKFAQVVSCRSGRGEDIFDGDDIVLDVMQIELALEIGNGQGFQFKSFPGHKPLFHAALGTDEENVAVLLALPEHFGQRDGGIDVARGTAAGKYDIHENSSRQLNQLLRVPAGHAKYNSHLHQLQHQRSAAVGKEGQ